MVKKYFSLAYGPAKKLTLRASFFAGWVGRSNAPGVGAVLK
jgi:hypothetical protein